MPDAELVRDAFLRMIARLAEEPRVAPRLALAGVVAQINFSDAPGVSLVLRLNGEPIEATAGDDPRAEVVLDARTADVVAFWRGEYHLAMGIARGEVSYSGPVRKLLRVVPIARSMSHHFDLEPQHRSVPEEAT